MSKSLTFEQFTVLQEIEQYVKLPEETPILSTMLYDVTVAELRILQSEEWLNDKVIRQK